MWHKLHTVVRKKAEYAIWENGKYLAECNPDGDSGMPDVCIVRRDEVSFPDILLLKKGLSVNTDF